MKKQTKGSLSIFSFIVLVVMILMGIGEIGGKRTAKASTDTTAYICYIDASWAYQYWYGGDYAPVKAKTAKVTGEGQYTIGLDFTKTDEGYASGLMFAGVEISNGETEYEGYTIRIDSFKINGSLLTLGKGCTVSEGKNTRYDIYNEWAPKPDQRVDGDARSWDGVISNATSTPAASILDRFEQVKTIEITFTYAKEMGTLKPTETPTQSPAQKEYHAYLGFQTDVWDYRNDYKNDADSKQYDFYNQVMIGGKATDVTAENATLTSNGTYSVGISGANLTNASKFNMLYISTDIPVTMKNVTFSDIKVILDGKEVTTLKTGVLKQECQTGSYQYYMIMAVNCYGERGVDAVEEFSYNMPSKSMSLKFTVSGIDFPEKNQGLKTTSLSAKYTTVKKQNVQKAAVKLNWSKSSEAEGYVVYRASGGKYQLIATIDKKNQNYYTDSDVTKGKAYTYKVRAYAIGEDGWTYGTYSPARSVKVSTTLLTPSVSFVKKGNKVTFTFSQAEGTNYESQYRYLGTKQWKALDTLQGKIQKAVTKKIKAEGFQIRIRTYMKINGKKVYSKYCKTMTIR